MRFSHISNRTIFSLILLLFLSSCSTGPVLYPNKKLRAVGEEKAQNDIDQCMALADRYVKSSKWKQVGTGAAKGGVIGGAMGVVTGLFTGDVLRGLAAGTAIGAAGGGAAGAMTPERVKRKFTSICLKKKGYQVIGWE